MSSLKWTKQNSRFQTPVLLLLQAISQLPPPSSSCSCQKCGCYLWFLFCNTSHLLHTCVLLALPPGGILNVATSLCSTAVAHLQATAICQPTSCRGSLNDHLTFTLGPFFSAFYRAARMIILKCKSDGVAIMYQSSLPQWLPTPNSTKVQAPYTGSLIPWVSPPAYAPTW